jgi:Icc-related predicted phosphoesterase
MQIQVMSDLHLEFGAITPKFHPDADILILAGDILVADHIQRGSLSPRWKHVEAYDAFLNAAAEHFSRVIMIMGNHEHYNGRFWETAHYIRNRYPWLVLLDNETVEIGGKKIWGGTLWTSLDRNPVMANFARNALNDFKLIKYTKERKYSPSDFIKEHDNALSSLKLANADIVISHHAPSRVSTPSKYKGDMLNGAYANSLEEFMLDSNIKLWIHGHMHNSSDYMIGDCRVVCNPRGYTGHDLNTEFTEELVLQV